MAEPYNFTTHLREGKWEVHIDPQRAYGYFEHDDYGEGGGLWFEGTGKLILRDYDGQYVLPPEVAKALRAEGITVTPDFD